MAVLIGPDDFRAHPGRRISSGPPLICVNRRWWKSHIEWKSINSPKRLFSARFLGRSRQQARLTIREKAGRWPASTARNAANLVFVVNGAVETFRELNALPVSAAVLDSAGQIVAVNEMWKEFGRKNGLHLHNAGIGSNYLQYCETGTAASSEFAKELKALLAGRLDLLTLVYPCDSPDEKRWFYLIGMPLSRAKASGVALLHVNLTDMLPRDVGAKAMQVTTGKVHPAGNVDAISTAIERSVSETLSSQLNAMFAGAQPVSAAGDTSEAREGDRAMVSSRLSKRQIEVLRLLGQGKTNKEIARELFRSPNTVKLHVSAILHQLKLKSRTQAALLASRLYKDNAAGQAGGDVKSWKKTRTMSAQHRRPVGEMARND